MACRGFRCGGVGSPWPAKLVFLASCSVHRRPAIPQGVAGFLCPPCGKHESEAWAGRDGRNGMRVRFRHVNRLWRERWWEYQGARICSVRSRSFTATPLTDDKSKTDISVHRSGSGALHGDRGCDGNVGESGCGPRFGTVGRQGEGEQGSPRARRRPDRRDRISHPPAPPSLKPWQPPLKFLG